MTRRRVILGSIAVLAAWIVTDHLVVTDEEALEALITHLAEALEHEDPTGLLVLLAPDHHFSGPDPIGRGDLEVLAERLGVFFTEASEIHVGIGRIETTIAGAVAAVSFSASTRFRWGGSQVPVRADIVIDCQRIGKAWIVVELRVTQLRPGVF